jgi:hypothetical protein
MKMNEFKVRDGRDNRVYVFPDLIYCRIQDSATREAMRLVSVGQKVELVGFEVLHEG